MEKDGTHQTYHLEPDHEQMITFAAQVSEPCALVVTASATSERWHRDGYSLHASSLKGGEIAKTEEKGTAHVGSISDVQLANIGDGRVVTAVISGSGDLELITWGFRGRRNHHTRARDGSRLHKVSIVNLGLAWSLLARTAADTLKIILWKVTPTATSSARRMTRWRHQDLRLARVGKEHGRSVPADGRPFEIDRMACHRVRRHQRHASATAGTVTELAAITEHPIILRRRPRQSFELVLTAVRRLR
jgi:hypothetical protein